MKRLLCLVTVTLLSCFLFSNIIFAHEVNSSSPNDKNVASINENQIEDSYRYNIKVGFTYILREIHTIEAINMDFYYQKK